MSDKNSAPATPQPDGKADATTTRPTDTFQGKTTKLAVAKLQEIMQEIPELRSLIIVFDWRDNLADFSPCGAWVTPNGLIDANLIDEIPSGMIQLARMFQTQQQLSLQHINRLQQVTGQYRQLAEQAKETIDAQKQKIEKARQSGAPELVPGESRPDGNVGGPAPAAKNKP